MISLKAVIVHTHAHTTISTDSGELEPHYSTHTLQIIKFVCFTCSITTIILTKCLTQTQLFHNAAPAQCEQAPCPGPVDGVHWGNE